MVIKYIFYYHLLKLYTVDLVISACLNVREFLFWNFSRFEFRNFSFSLVALLY